MLFATVGQGSVFLWMLLAGMLIGLLYDGFGLLRYVLRAGTALTMLLDVLWGAASGVLLAVMLVIANRGRLRLYVLAAVLLGFVLYRAAASRPMRMAVGRVGRLVKKLPIFRLLKIVFR